MKTFRWTAYPLSSAMLLTALAFVLCHAFTFPGRTITLPGVMS
jgi:hypothetical protein